jgi:hypothetical protein
MSMLDAVLDYVDQHGFEMLPAPPTGEKKPIGLGGKDFENATSDKTELEKHWTKHPDANIIRRVAGTVVLDIESAEGHPKAAQKAQGEGKKFGLDAFVELQREYGQLPKTLVYSTWSGGLQVTCLRPAGDLQFKSGEIAPGVELKHNGIVMLPPSVRNGKAYTMLDDVPVAELPPEWVAFCTKDEPDEQEWQAIKRHSRKIAGGKTLCEKYGISIVDVMPELHFGKKTSNGYLLKHPIHGADGNGNLSVSTTKNLWKCFRCDSGGDPLTWIAVREGFISCEDAGPLDYETFRLCRKVAQEDGLIHDEWSDKNGITTDTRSAVERQGDAL